VDLNEPHGKGLAAVRTLHGRVEHVVVTVVEAGAWAAGPGLAGIISIVPVAKAVDVYHFCDRKRGPVAQSGLGRGGRRVKLARKVAERGGILRVARP
jgi:hypothetical protein